MGNLGEEIAELQQLNNCSCDNCGCGESPEVSELRQPPFQEKAIVREKDGVS